MRHFRTLAPVAAGGIATILVAAAMPEPLLPTIAEDGPVETLSALLLVLAAILTLGLAPFWEWLHVAAIVLLLAEREFDADTLPAGSALRTALEWVETHVLHEPLAAAALALWLLAGLALVSWRHWRHAWTSGAVAPRLFLLGCAFAVLAEIASQAAKHLAGRLGPNLLRRLEVAEEFGELWFCIALLGAVCLFLLDQRTLRRLT